MDVAHGRCTYQFKEALGCGIVVASLINQVLRAHVIHIDMHICHESANTRTNFTLQVPKKIYVIFIQRDTGLLTVADPGAGSLGSKELVSNKMDVV